MTKSTGWLRWLLPALLLIVTTAVFCWRWSGIEDRPMHHDEANQAVRCGDLLDGRGYRYDPDEHHGPSLYYLSVPLLRLQGVRSLAASSERHFRLLPLLFGCLLIMQVLWWRRWLGAAGVLAAALLLALSPAQSYYSRYYIQETLLVFFAGGALCCLWRWFQAPRWRWSLGLGLMLGLASATKETWVISAAALAGGALLLYWERTPEARRKLSADAWRQGPWALLLLLLISGLFFSSFGRYPGGLVDAVLAYGTYFQRAGGGAHEQPWYFYAQRLLWYRSGPGPHWSEWPIALLALVGLSGLMGRGRWRSPQPRLLQLYLAAYALMQAVIYSLIAYKTPWCALVFWHGFILLAGCGVAAIHAWLRRWYWQIPGMLLCALLLWPLAEQTRRANGRYAADGRNPYAYVHTLPDAQRLVRRVDAVSSLTGGAASAEIVVVSSDEDAWPLPWLLRRYERVVYCSQVGAALAEPRPQFILCATAFDDELEGLLGASYQRELYGWRPNCLMVLRIRRDAWDAWLQGQ